jgi:hypothetical protein
MDCALAEELVKLDEIRQCDDDDDNGGGGDDDSGDYATSKHVAAIMRYNNVLYSIQISFYKP